MLSKYSYLPSHFNFKVNEMGGGLKAKVDMKIHKELRANKEYSANLYFTYT